RFERSNFYARADWARNAALVGCRCARVPAPIQRRAIAQRRHGLSQPAVVAYRRKQSIRHAKVIAVDAVGKAAPPEEPIMLLKEFVRSTEPPLPISISDALPLGRAALPTASTAIT